jgi:hypothetical protein
VKYGERSDSELRVLTGALLHVVKARPEISYIVNFLCQFNGRFSDEIIEIGLRVVKYLYYTRDYSLKIEGGDLKLSCYCDASFGKELDLKSRTGVIIFVSGSFLCAISQKQSIVVDSSTYAEVKACLRGVKELEYYVNWFEQLGIKQDRVIVYQDNKSGIRILSKGELQGRSKHFDIGFLYVTQRVTNGNIALKYVKTNEMVADGLTKPVGKNHFYQMMKIMGIWVHDC